MEERTYQGSVYRRSGPGQPWTLVSASPSGPVMVGGGDPRLSSQVAKTQADAQSATATAPYAGPAAAADLTGRTLSNQKTAAELASEAREREGAAEKARQKRINQGLQSDVVLKNVEEARALIKEGGTTGWSALMANLPETRARRLRNIFETLRSNLTFDRLQQMRDESVTGGAVGNASDADMRLLGATIGSLDQGQADTDLNNVLNDVEGKYLKVLADNEGVDLGAFRQQYNNRKQIASGSPFTAEQQRIYDAYMSSNPSATAEQARAFLSAAGLPEVNNLDQIIAARSKAGVAPAGSARYEDSYLGQGMSGINEGIGNTLGAPVDIVTSALNLVPQGVNAIANTDLGQIENPFMGSQWWNDTIKGAGSIFPETQDPVTQFIRRTGQSLGGAAIPIGATARTGNQALGALGSALGGGIGAATAQQVRPNDPIAEILGEMVGGGIGGYGALRTGQRAAQREIESAIPTVDDLKGQANQLYRQAEMNGVTADPGLVRQLDDSIVNALRREGQIGPTGAITSADTSTTKAKNLIGQYADSNTPINPTEMNTIRKVIAEGRSSTDAADQRLSGILLGEFDDWAAPLAPEFENARGVASRYLQAEDLEKARELAGARASQFSGSGFENALRTDYRALDRANIKGQNYFAPEVVEAIQNVSRGTTGSNIARAIGRFAPTTPVAGTLSMAGPAAIGTILGGPVAGVAAGAGAGAIGAVGRKVATDMGIRNADVAELLARNGGAIPQADLINPELNNLIAAILSGQVAQASGQ